MEERPNYYAIIPANVRYDKTLKDKAKLLFGEIYALSSKNGFCYASNSYFAKLYGVSTNTISSLIKNLVDRGYVETTYVYKEGTQEILYRYTKILGEGIQKNLDRGIQKNLKENNTSINNINLIKERKKEAKTYNDILADFNLSERLTKTIMDFIAMRKMMKKPMTNRGLELMINKLQKMATDEQTQIEILEQSIMNNWQGLYELKKTDTASNTNDEQQEIYKRFLERNWCVMTKDEFLEETQKLSDLFKRNLNETQLQFWFDELKGFDIDKYKRAVGEFAKYSSKMPALSEVLAKIRNLRTLGVDDAIQVNKERIKCETCNGSGLVKYYLKENGRDYEYLCRCYCKNAEQYQDLPIRDYKDVFYYRKPSVDAQAVDYDFSQINF